MNNAEYGAFCWNELATADLEAAKKFYGSVFGWQFSEHDMGDMTYTMIKRHHQEFAGIWSIPKDQAQHIAPHWMSYILVENIEDSLQKALEHGASVIKPISPAGTMGLLAIIQDPTGAHLALWQDLTMA